jgi:hypothetical protein
MSNLGNDVKQISAKLDNDLIKKANELEHVYRLCGGNYNNKCCMSVYKLDGVCEAFRDFAYIYRWNFSDDCEVKNPLSDKNEQYLNYYVISDINYNYRTSLYTVFTTMAYDRWCQMMNIINSQKF